MNGFCLIWSRRRIVSLPPSLPVGDDRYLNLSSQKQKKKKVHKSDPRAEISEEIVRYDALAPRPEVLLS